MRTICLRIPSMGLPIPTTRSTHAAAAVPAEGAEEALVLVRQQAVEAHGGRRQAHSIRTRSLGTCTPDQPSGGLYRWVTSAANLRTLANSTPRKAMSCMLRR